MRRPSLSFRLVAVSAALVALVAVLGTLQYRWLGQVSEAERERLQKSVRVQAQNFADAFDAEVLWIEMAFQANVPENASDAERLVRCYELWQEKARYPNLVRDVFVVSPGPETRLQRLERASRGLVDVNWPAALDVLRSRSLALGHVEALPPSGDTPRLPDMLLLRDPIVASIPAVLVSLSSSRFIAVQLDRDYIRSSVLPSLAGEYVGGQEAQAYRMAVVAQGAEAGRQKIRETIFSRGLPAGDRWHPAHADAVVPLFGLRPDLASRVAPRLGVRMPASTDNREVLMGSQTVTAIAQNNAASDAPTRAGAIAIFMQTRNAAGAVVKFNARGSVTSAWQLVLQHPAGSLDIAVASARRRNLWLGFGILAVLAASVALVVLNAQRAQHLAAQQMDFVATVSHELRTPLAVIRSAAQNLSAGVITDAERTRHYGEMIDAEGRRLTEMVEQVLEYAGLGGNRAAARRAVDVPSLLQEMAVSWKSMLAAQQVELALDVDRGLPAVEADEGALRRVLNNLVTNAAKYGGDGKWIGIAAASRPGRGQQEVCITVTDRGRGVAPSDLPHIFEPFYRGHDVIERQIPGNGLGLSLVKRVVEAHGGRTTVKSSPGHGSSFTIWLPAAVSS